MFRSIFRPYGLVWRILNTITDVLGLSLLWCLCSLPLVTMGAATTALYDAAVRGIRYREEVVYRRFFRTFRAELKTASLVTVVWGLILLLCSYILALLDGFAPDSRQAAIMAGGYRVLMGIPLTCACWSCAILSRFSHSFRSLTATAVRFLPAHLLSSVGIGLLTWGCLRFCREYLIAITYAPAVLMLAWSLFAEPVFRKYGGGLEPPKTDEA